MTDLKCTSCGATDWRYDRKRADGFGMLTIECRKCQTKQSTTIAVIDAYESALARSAMVSVATEFALTGAADTGRTGGADAFIDGVTRTWIDQWTAQLGRWPKLFGTEKDKIATELITHIADPSHSPKHIAEMQTLLEEWKCKKREDNVPRFTKLIHAVDNIESMNNNDRRSLHAQTKQMQHDAKLFLQAEDMSHLQEARQKVANAIQWRWWEFLSH